MQREHYIQSRSLIVGVRLKSNSFFFSYFREEEEDDETQDGERNKKKKKNESLKLSMYRIEWFVLLLSVILA